MSAAPDTLASLDAGARNKEVRKVIFSSYLGSTIEFYDFLVYASASALVFPHMFFTDLDPLAGTIAAYGTFATGCLGRPLGGAVLGHFGDRLGRKKMLIISMLIMGIASTLIGLIPSAAVIGSWWAVILIVLRVCQGIAVGGEWGGAALMALEHSAQGRRGFAASFTDAGAPTGAAPGTFVPGLFAAMPEEQFLAWGRRVPFLLSVPAVRPAAGRGRPRALPGVREPDLPGRTGQGGRGGPHRQAQGAHRRGAAPTPRPDLHDAGGRLPFRPAGLPGHLRGRLRGRARRRPAARPPRLRPRLRAQRVLRVGMGRLSDQLGRRPVMVVGPALFIALIFPMFSWPATGNVLLIFASFTIGPTCHAAIHGPPAAFIAEQFGTSSRYPGASLGCQFATLIGVGFTPTILASVYASSGQAIAPVVWYLAGMAVVSAVFILLTRESKDVDLETHEH